ncbi:MAG: hypothetical protein IJU16_06350 [Clostridia bacterium]|nr:hypothetical protein [Clostridia bacterium]
MSRRTIKDFRRSAEEYEEEVRERPRRRKKTRHWPRIWGRILLVAVLVTALVLVIVNWKTIAPSSLVSWVDDLMSGTASGSWPVTLTGGSVTAIEEVSGGNVVLLSDSATIYYNGSGGESVRRVHAFTNPMMRTAGRYVLIAESGGNRFRLETRSDIELEQAVSNKICTVAVSENGDVAVVTDSSQSHISEVTVYSRKGNQRYQWLSAEWLVLDAAFSSNGQSLAVVGCRSANGAMQSAVITFDLRAGEDKSTQYDVTDTLYTRVKYVGNGTVAAVGDNGARVVRPGGSLDQTVDYEKEELIGMAFLDGIALVTRPYGSQLGGTLRLISSAGDVTLTQPFEGAFRDISIYSGRYLLLTDRTAYVIGRGGIEREAEVPSDSYMVSAIGDKALILGLTSLSEAVWK